MQRGSIDKLLHPDPKLGPVLAELQAASKSCCVPYRICGTNSFSGRGKPGVSDTFASALWGNSQVGWDLACEERRQNSSLR